MMTEEPIEMPTKSLPKKSAKTKTEDLADVSFGEVVSPTTITKQITVFRGRKVRVVEKEVAVHSRTAYFPSPPSQVNFRKKKIVSNSKNNCSRRALTFPEFRAQHPFFPDKVKQLQPQTHNTISTKQQLSTNTPGPHLISKHTYLNQGMDTIKANTMTVEESSQSYKVRKLTLKDNLERFGVASQNTGMSGSKMRNTTKQRKYQSTNTKESSEVPAKKLKKQTKEPFKLKADAKTEDLSGATHLMQKPSKVVQPIDTVKANTMTVEDTSQSYKVRKPILKDNLEIFGVASQNTSVSGSTMRNTTKQCKYQSTNTKESSEIPAKKPKKPTKEPFKLKADAKTEDLSGATHLMQKPSYVVQPIDTVKTNIMTVKESSQSYKVQKPILRDNLEIFGVASQNTGVSGSTMRNTTKQRKHPSMNTKEFSEIPAKKPKKPTKESSEFPTDAKTEDLTGAAHLISEPSSLVQAIEACIAGDLSIKEASQQFKVSRKTLNDNIIGILDAKSDVQKDPIFAHAIDLLLNYKCSVNEVHQRTGLCPSTLLFALEHFKQQSLVTTDIIVDSHTKDSAIAPSKVPAEELPEDHNWSANAAIQNTDVSQLLMQNSFKHYQLQSTVTADTTVNLQVNDSSIVPAKKSTKDRNQSANATILNIDKLQSTVTTATVNLQVKDSTIVSAKKPTKDLKWSVNAASQNTSMFQSTLNNFFKPQKRQSSITANATNDPQTEDSAIVPTEMLSKEPYEESTEILVEESIDELAEIPAEAKIEDIVRPTVDVKRFTEYHGRKVRVVEKEVAVRSQTAYFPHLLPQMNLCKKKVMDYREDDCSLPEYPFLKFKEHMFFSYEDEKLQPRTCNPLFVEPWQLMDKPRQQMVFNEVSTVSSRSNFLNLYPMTTLQSSTSSQEVMDINTFDMKEVNNEPQLGISDSAADTADDSINITDDASDITDDSERQLLPGPWWLSEICSFIRWFFIRKKRGDSHGEKRL